jgi:hypothetical protein
MIEEVVKWWTFLPSPCYEAVLAIKQKDRDIMIRFFHVAGTKKK